jgi:hypothetical protein
MHKLRIEIANQHHSRCEANQIQGQRVVKADVNGAGKAIVVSNTGMTAAPLWQD